LIFFIPLLKILDQLLEGAARGDFLLGRSVARDQVVGIQRLASLPVVQEDLDRAVVGAIVVLARRGLSLRDAKHVVERALGDGSSLIDLPAVESREGLIADLAAVGFKPPERTPFGGQQTIGCCAKLRSWTSSTPFHPTHPDSASLL
jgi:hypothetical protein